MGKSKQIILQELEGGHSPLTRLMARYNLSASADEQYFTALFPNTSFYCRSFDTLTSITKADVLVSFEKYYIPNNMTLVVIESFDRDAVKAWIDQTFATLMPGHAESEYRCEFATVCRCPARVTEGTPAPRALADDDELDEEGAGRDILGEMEIAARIMITGGDEREDARMTRADRFLIRSAIFLAAKTVKETGRDQVLTEDVVAALQNIGHDETLPDHRRNRALEMGDGMALFCSGLAGHFFNRPGTPWPQADVTILEMGILAREGYEDQLTVAYISMMSHINDLVERHQHDERPTLVVTDEGHIITTNLLLARYVVKITKMWRKLGAWFWIATQNLEDFPDTSRKMLNMMEWWLCLVMPKEEVEQIARFKDLTDVQRNLLLSARKEPGKYVEGVVLSDNLEALFRNVPPPLSLALAMTEKYEKAERGVIMREQNCSELEAVHIIAERIAMNRGG